MPVATERVFLVFGTGDQEVEVELTQAVNDVMILMQPWTANVSHRLLNRVRNGAIMGAAEAVVHDRLERGEMTIPRFVRRVPSPPSAKQ